MTSNHNSVNGATGWSERRPTCLVPQFFLSFEDGLPTRLQTAKGTLSTPQPMHWREEEYPLVEPATQPLSCSPQRPTVTAPNLPTPSDRLANRSSHLGLDRAPAPCVPCVNSRRLPCPHGHAIMLGPRTPRCHVRAQPVAHTPLPRCPTERSESPNLRWRQHPRHGVRSCGIWRRGPFPCPGSSLLCAGISKASCTCTPRRAG